MRCTVRFQHLKASINRFSRSCCRKIKAFLYEHLASAGMLAFAEAQITHTKYRNIDDFLESLIFEKPVAAIVVIDQSTPELENLRSLRMYKYQKVLKLQFAPVINVGSITTRYGLFI